MNPFPTYTEACTAVCASKQLEVPGSLRFATHNIFGAWRSPVAHLLWEQGVPSSNLGAPTETTAVTTMSYVLPIKQRMKPQELLSAVNPRLRSAFRIVSSSGC